MAVMNEKIHYSLTPSLFLMDRRKMEDRMMKNKLIGWDDGKLYFYDENGKEFCVNDHQELFERIVKACEEYFKQKEKIEKTGE